MIEAECICRGNVWIRRNGVASYFYCSNPCCHLYHEVFRCFGSRIDNNLKRSLIDELREHDESIDMVIIRGTS